MSSNKGKFINAFQSIKMLEDYDQFEFNNESNKEKVEDLHANNESIHNELVNNQDKDGELYNPLEDMDVGSDSTDDSNFADPAQIEENNLSNDDKLAEDSIKSADHKKSNEVDIFANMDETTNDVSDGDTCDDNEAVEQEKRIIAELEESVKTKELSSTKVDFIDDGDELLGTALAELEAEEQEKQEELKKLMLLETEEVEGKKIKKKKKKGKEKSSSKSDDSWDKDSKKKRKKKKKKKGKEKEKDLDDDKKKKKSKEKKGKKDLESFVESCKREVHKFDNGDKKTEVKKPTKSHKLSKNDKEDVLSEPKKEDHKKKSTDKNKDRRSSSSQDKKKESSRSSKDHSSRKRSSRDSTDEHYSSKRSRRDDSSERHRRSRDKHSRHRDRSEEKELKHKQRSNHDSRRSSHSRVRTSPDKSKLDYEIKLPKHDKYDKKETHDSPAKLSKDEFYNLQNKVHHQINDKHSQSTIQSKKTRKTSDSSTVESDVEVEKALHRSSLSENYKIELGKYKHDIEHSNEHSNEHSSKSENLNVSTEHISTPKRSRKHSESKHSHRKSSTPPNDSHKHTTRNRKRSNSEGHLHRELPKETSALNVSHVSEDNAHVKTVVPVENDTPKPESIEKPKHHIEMPAENLDEKNSCGNKSIDLSVSDKKKTLKPGSLSLNQYKERRSSGKKSYAKQNSNEATNFVIDEKSTISTPESSADKGNSSFDRENKENVPRDENELASTENLNRSCDVTTDGPDQHVSNHVKRNESIPLLFDDETKHELHNSSQSLTSDNDAPAAKPESPYNPEAASPLDMASPSCAAIEDREDVDFNAYKDVVAFEDIMKSKVKHEARKHKRRKLEELKAEFGSPPASSKEGKLVDYLVRQAQVEEEMKTVLKQYFKSHEITKEEYKNILKKAVPQVTMSNSPIVPDKIASLMVKFVRKCKGNRAKEEKNRRKQQKQLHDQQKQLQLQLQTSAAMFQQIRVLNPDLPMPPV